MRDRAYRPDIDGIRAIAILSVALYHAGVPWMTGGFTGVDIFFVISGYLIGGHIFSELSAGSFSYLQFYKRRAKRILPAFYAVLAFILLASLILLLPEEALLAAKSAFAATLSSSNILFWHSIGYFDTRSQLDPLLMTWSLGVEEQFYVVVPLVMVLVVRLRRSLLLPALLIVCAISFLWACLALNSHPGLVFYMLPTRAWELGVGVVLAVVELRRRRKSLPTWLIQALSVIGLALMLGPVFVLTAATPFPGAAALPSVLGAALILATPASWINQRFLALPPITFIGRVSYSWYLWHWPLLAFTRLLYLGNLPLRAAMFAIAAAFGMAVLSYFLVEQPCRKSSTEAGPLLLRYAAVSILVLFACAGVWLSNGVPQRFPALAQAKAQEDQSNLLHDPCLVRDNIDQPNRTPACFEASATTPAVALWGDSHAAALAPGLRDSLHAQHYSFVQFTRTGCLPLIGAAVYISKTPLDEPACVKYNRNILSSLAADQHIRTVILAGFWEGPLQPEIYRSWLISTSAHNHTKLSQDASRELLRLSLAASIQALHDAGKQVIVVEDTPVFDFAPDLRVLACQIHARQSLARFVGVQNPDDPGFAPPRVIPIDAETDPLLREAVASLSGVTLLDLKPEFCSASTQCTYRIGDQVLFWDTHHFSPEGARYAFRDFKLPALTAGGK